MFAHYFSIYLKKKYYVRKMAKKQPSWRKEIEEYLELTKIGINQNYFKFGGKYKQKFG